MATRALTIALALALVGAASASGSMLHPASRSRARGIHAWRGSANLVDPTAIPAVAAAVAQARAHDPIPAPLKPASLPGSLVRHGCVPTFGPGLTYRLCRLGSPRARHVVVLLGDSHASMWLPAFIAVARQLDFSLVPVTKPGCAIWAIHENRPGWPCSTWYRGALANIASIHPSATVVSFMTANFTVPQASLAAAELQRVLRAVPHPVLLADTPSENWYQHNVADPKTCLRSPGANQGTCAMPEVAQVRATLAHIQAMVNRDGYPAIPTLQWFCADDICPTVIDDTPTTEDGNHITDRYASLLAPRLANRLRPILAWRFRTERTRP